MTRLTSIATQLMVVAALATPAFAQSQSEIASKLNDEGKELMFGGKYADASGKFREAVARVPEPKYFFNLCTSLFQEGRFSDAMVACSAVANNKPTPELQAKTDKLIGRIEAEAKAQNIELRPEGGGGGDTNLPPNGDPNQPPPDPNNPNPDPNATPQPGFAPAVGKPPAQGVFQGTTSDNKYTWTLGMDLYGGGGQVGQPNQFGSAAGGFRVKGDYLLNPATRFGAQGYVQFTNFTAGEMDSSEVDTLAIVDIGLAAYKHLCPKNYQRLCLTPLAGLQLAAMSPSGETNAVGDTVFQYSALGARLELGLQWGLGKRMEHVLGVQVGVNAYTAVFSGPADDSSMVSIVNAGLDKGGAVGYFGLGYTYRFNTPLGSSPFVTLE